MESEVCLNKIIELQKQQWELILSLIGSSCQCKTQVNEDYFIPFDDFTETRSKNSRYFSLTVRTVNCLQTENLYFIGDLICNPKYERLKEKFLLQIPNFGKKSFKELMQQLESVGLTTYQKCDLYWTMRKHVTDKDIPEGGQ